MICKRYDMLGSIIELCIEAPQEIAEPIMDEAYLLGLRLQKIFNVYDPQSELSVLNQNRAIIASPELLYIMRIALGFCELTGGEYDISLGKQFLERKYKKVLSDVRCSYKDISIDQDSIRLLNDDVLIDLGSIAKGYIGERIARFLMEQGIESGYVDARGDLRMFGEPKEIDIQNPRGSGYIRRILVQDKGVATSGDYRQFDADYSRSHVIHQKDVISATVISDDLTIADAYATILMVCKKETREKLISESGLYAMTVDKDLNISYYNGFEELIVSED